MALSMALILLTFIEVRARFQGEALSQSDLINVCPKVTCSEPLGDGVCFMHSGTSPVEWIKLYACNPGY